MSRSRGAEPSRRSQLNVCDELIISRVNRTDDQRATDSNNIRIGTS